MNALDVSAIYRARPDDMIHLDDVRQMRVNSHRDSVNVSHDGEVAEMTSPLDYGILPGALTVVVP
nr:hypothetical protein [uncultured Sphingomonas sp.]